MPLGSASWPSNGGPGRNWWMRTVGPPHGQETLSPPGMGRGATAAELGPPNAYKRPQAQTRVLSFLINMTLSRFWHQATPAPVEFLERVLPDISHMDGRSPLAACL